MASMKEGDHVLALYGPVLYEAQVVKVRLPPPGEADADEPDAELLLHYLKWSKRWDAWVPSSLVLEKNAENLARKARLMRAFREMGSLYKQRRRQLSASQAGDACASKGTGQGGGKSRDPTDADPDTTTEACGICMEAVQERGLLDCCRHWFCFHCVDEWAQVTNTCPLCKARFRVVAKYSMRVADDGSEGDPMVNAPVGMVVGNRDQPHTWYDDAPAEYFPDFFINESDVECLPDPACIVRTSALRRLEVGGEEGQEEETDGGYSSVECDLCKRWYHATCVGFDMEPGTSVEEEWACPVCQQEPITLGSVLTARLEVHPIASIGVVTATTVMADIIPDGIYYSDGDAGGSIRNLDVRAGVDHSGTYDPISLITRIAVDSEARDGGHRMTPATATATTSAGTGTLGGAAAAAAAPLTNGGVHPTKLGEGGGQQRGRAEASWESASTTMARTAAASRTAAAIRTATTNATGASSGAGGELAGGILKVNSVVAAGGASSSGRPAVQAVDAAAVVGAQGGQRREVSNRDGHRSKHEVAEGQGTGPSGGEREGEHGVRNKRRKVEWRVEPCCPLEERGVPVDKSNPRMGAGLVGGRISRAAQSKEERSRTGLEEEASGSRGGHRSSAGSPGSCQLINGGRAACGGGGEKGVGNLVGAAGDARGTGRRGKGKRKVEEGEGEEEEGKKCDVEEEELDEDEEKGEEEVFEEEGSEEGEEEGEETEQEEEGARVVRKKPNLMEKSAWEEARAVTDGGVWGTVSSRADRAGDVLEALHAATLGEMNADRRQPVSDRQARRYSDQQFFALGRKEGPGRLGKCSLKRTAQQEGGMGAFEHRSHDGAPIGEDKAEMGDDKDNNLKRKGVAAKIRGAAPSKDPDAPLTNCAESWMDHAASSAGTTAPSSGHARQVHRALPSKQAALANGSAEATLQGRCGQADDQGSLQGHQGGAPPSSTSQGSHGRQAAFGSRAGHVEAGLRGRREGEGHVSGGKGGTLGGGGHLLGGGDPSLAGGERAPLAGGGPLLGGKGSAGSALDGSGSTRIVNATRKVPSDWQGLLGTSPSNAPTAGSAGQSPLSSISLPPVTPHRQLVQGQGPRPVNRRGTTGQTPSVESGFALTTRKHEGPPPRGTRAATVMATGEAGSHGQPMGVAGCSRATGGLASPRPISGGDLRGGQASRGGGSEGTTPRGRPSPSVGTAGVSSSTKASVCTRGSLPVGRATVGSDSAAAPKGAMARGVVAGVAAGSRIHPLQSRQSNPPQRNPPQIDRINGHMNLDHGRVGGSGRVIVGAPVAGGLPRGMLASASTRLPRSTGGMLASAGVARPGLDGLVGSGGRPASTREGAPRVPRAQEEEEDVDAAMKRVVAAYVQAAQATPHHVQLLARDFSSGIGHARFKGGGAALLARDGGNSASANAGSGNGKEWDDGAAAAGDTARGGAPKGERDNAGGAGRAEFRKMFPLLSAVAPAMRPVVSGSLHASSKLPRVMRQNILNKLAEAHLARAMHSAGPRYDDATSIRYGDDDKPNVANIDHHNAGIGCTDEAGERCKGGSGEIAVGAAMMAPSEQTHVSSLQSAAAAVTTNENAVTNSKNTVTSSRNTVTNSKNTVTSNNLVAAVVTAASSRAQAALRLAAAKEAELYRSCAGGGKSVYINAAARAIREISCGAGGSSGAGTPASISNDGIAPACVGISTGHEVSGGAGGSVCATMPASISDDGTTPSRMGTSAGRKKSNGAGGASSSSARQSVSTDGATPATVTVGASISAGQEMYSGAGGGVSGRDGGPACVRTNGAGGKQAQHPRTGGAVADDVIIGETSSEACGGDKWLFGLGCGGGEGGDGGGGGDGAGGGGGCVTPASIRLTAEVLMEDTAVASHDDAGSQVCLLDDNGKPPSHDDVGRDMPLSGDAGGEEGELGRSRAVADRRGDHVVIREGILAVMGFVDAEEGGGKLSVMGSVDADGQEDHHGQDAEEREEAGEEREKEEAEERKREEMEGEEDAAGPEDAEGAIQHPFVQGLERRGNAGWDYGHKDAGEDGSLRDEKQSGVCGKRVPADGRGDSEDGRVNHNDAGEDGEADHEDVDTADAEAHKVAGASVCAAPRRVDGAAKCDGNSDGKGPGKGAGNSDGQTDGDTLGGTSSGMSAFANDSDVRYKSKDSSSACLKSTKYGDVLAPSSSVRTFAGGSSGSYVPWPGHCSAPVNLDGSGHDVVMCSIAVTGSRRDGKRAIEDDVGGGGGSSKRQRLLSDGGGSTVGETGEFGMPLAKDYGVPSSNEHDMSVAKDHGVPFAHGDGGRGHDGDVGIAGYGGGVGMPADPGGLGGGTYTAFDRHGALSGSSRGGLFSKGGGHSIRGGLAVGSEEAHSSPGAESIISFATKHKQKAGGRAPPTTAGGDSVCSVQEQVSAFVGAILRPVVTAGRLTAEEGDHIARRCQEKVLARHSALIERDVTSVLASQEKAIRRLIDGYVLKAIRKAASVPTMQ